MALESPVAFGGRDRLASSRGGRRGPARDRARAAVAHEGQGHPGPLPRPRHQRRRGGRGLRVASSPLALQSAHSELGCRAIARAAERGIREFVVALILGRDLRAASPTTSSPRPPAACLQAFEPVPHPGHGCRWSSSTRPRPCPFSAHGLLGAGAGRGQRISGSSSSPCLSSRERDAHCFTGPLQGLLRGDGCTDVLGCFIGSTALRVARCHFSVGELVPRPRGRSLGAGRLSASVPSLLEITGA